MKTEKTKLTEPILYVETWFLQINKVDYKRVKNDKKIYWSIWETGTWEPIITEKTRIEKLEKFFKCNI